MALTTGDSTTLFATAGAAFVTAGTAFFTTLVTAVSFAVVVEPGFKNPNSPPAGDSALTTGTLVIGAGAGAETAFFATGATAFALTGGGAENADSSLAVRALGSLGSNMSPPDAP